MSLETRQNITSSKQKSSFMNPTGAFVRQARGAAEPGIIPNRSSAAIGWNDVITPKPNANKK